MSSVNSVVIGSGVEVVLEEVLGSVQKFARSGAGAPAAPIVGSLNNVEEVPITKPRLS